MKKLAVQTLLQHGIRAAKAGQNKRAYQILKQVIETDNTNIQAWLWLSAVVETSKGKRICLQNVLKLDPNHKRAQAGLALRQVGGLFISLWKCRN